jgi:uncharacterized membrane protein YfcA
MGVYALVLDVREAVPMATCLSIAVGSTVLWRWRREVRLRNAAPLMLGGLCGIPLGVTILTRWDERPLVFTLGGLTICYAAWSLLRAPRQVEDGERAVHAMWGVLAGFAGGVVGGAFNMGGPPVVAYGLHRRFAQGAFVATIQTYFLLMSFTQLALLSRAGLATSESLELAALSAPAVVGGVLLGSRLSRRVDPVAFRRIVHVLLLGLGAALLAR